MNSKSDLLQYKKFRNNCYISLKNHATQNHDKTHVIHTCSGHQSLESEYFFILYVHLNMIDNCQYCLYAKEIMTKCVISTLCKQSLSLTLSETMYCVHAILLRKDTVFVQSMYWSEAIVHFRGRARLAPAQFIC